MSNLAAIRHSSRKVWFGKAWLQTKKKKMIFAPDNTKGLWKQKELHEWKLFTIT